MKPYYDDGDGIVIYHGDSLATLRAMDSESVQCCVTSPPYWGLRDYGTVKWKGGDSSCNHSVGNQVQDNKAIGAITTGQRPGIDASVCIKCGAIRIDSQLGLEKTHEEYVEKMVEVFHEVKRVLRGDGTLWLNLGDSYGSGQRKTQKSQTVANGNRQDLPIKRGKQGFAKQLIGIPWLVAFALQSDGWYLRSDIIWSKPNPMPESVKDRPTKSHEYIFLMSKSKKYFYDADAIKEPTVTSDASVRDRDMTKLNNTPGRTRMGGLTVNNYNNRNKRSVWTVNTKPYKEAHFATFPPDLIKPCIMAGSKKGDVVLDPFSGSGTTGYVSKELNRKSVMIELKEEYIQLQIDRSNQGVLSLKKKIRRK